MRNILRGLFRAVIYLSAFGMVLAKIAGTMQVAGVLLAVCAAAIGGCAGMELMGQRADSRWRERKR